MVSPIRVPHGHPAPPETLLPPPCHLRVPLPARRVPHPGAHLEGLPGEVGGAEFALDPALGAAVLHVLGQVAAAQLGAAAVGAGDNVEGAGAEVDLGAQGRSEGGGGPKAPPRRSPRSSPCPPAPTWRCLMSPLQRQPSSLWMQRMARLNTCTSSSGSG